MCIRYICRGCRWGKIIYCDSADANRVAPDCRLPTTDPEPHKKRRRCPTCEVIEGAIYKLRDLVFQYPWLATEGMEGADTRAEWETKGLHSPDKICIDSQGDEDADLMNRLEAMGLDRLEGREALNDGYGLPDPPKYSEVTSSDLESGKSTGKEIFWGSGGTTLVSVRSVEQEIEEMRDQEVDMVAGGDDHRSSAVV